MKQQEILRQFAYSIPASAYILSELKLNELKAEHLPLLNVFIDFENGNLKLEGDWLYMMASNKLNKETCYTYHKERVKIKSAIFPALAINLDDPNNEGLAFAIDGKITDSESSSACSGLMVIDNIRGSDGQPIGYWNISIYLYDIQLVDCEIKFKLPVYLVNGKIYDN